MDLLLHHLVEEQVERTPDRVVLVEQQLQFANDNAPLDKEGRGLNRSASSITNDQPSGLTVSITYDELNRKSRVLAGILKKRSVQTDTLVGIMMERGIDMITGIIAILKAGGPIYLLSRDTPRSASASCWPMQKPQSC